MVHCALAVFAESHHDRYLLTPLLLTLTGFPGAAPKLLLTLFRKIPYGFTSAKFLSLVAVRSQGRRLIKSLIPNPIANVRIFTNCLSATAAGSSTVRFKRQPLVAWHPKPCWLKFQNSSKGQFQLPRGHTRDFKQNNNHRIIIACSDTIWLKWTSRSKTKTPLHAHH